jgi:hypothetical protein
MSPAFKAAFLLLGLEMSYSFYFTGFEKEYHERLDGKSV